MWDYTVTVTLSQISPTFWKIPREFPEKFGNLVRISGVWIKNSGVCNEHSSGLNIPVVEYWKYYWIFNLLKFYGILFTVFPTEIFNLSFLLIKIYSILL